MSDEKPRYPRSPFQPQQRFSGGRYPPKPQSNAHATTDERLDRILTTGSDELVRAKDLLSWVKQNRRHQRAYEVIKLARVSRDFDKVLKDNEIDDKTRWVIIDHLAAHNPKHPSSDSLGKLARRMSDDPT